MHFPAARHVRALHRVSQAVPALHLRNFHLTIPDLNFPQEEFGSHLSFFPGLSLPQNRDAPRQAARLKQKTAL